MATLEHSHSDSRHHLSTTTNLNWWTFRRQLSAQLVTTGDTYRAIDTLLATNNRHGSTRCTGVLKLIDGVPSLSYCGRWHCWKCGETRLWNERKRLLHGAEQIAAAGALWFTTVYDTDTQRSVQPIDFQVRLSRLLDTWRKKAQRDGVALQYATVYGFKPTTGQIHAHILSNWLPAPFSAPTRRHQYHHRDAWLDGRAALGNLTLWHELAQSVQRVAHYSANNLKSVLRVDLPSNFQRLVYSRNFPKLPATVATDTQQPIYKYTQTNSTHADKPHTAHSDASAIPLQRKVSTQDGDRTQRTADRRRTHARIEPVVMRDNRRTNKLLHVSSHHAKPDANTGTQRRTEQETFDAAPQIRVPP
jgi:hypothetical protein